MSRNRIQTPMEKTFDALRELEDEGRCSDIKQHSERLISCTNPYDWYNLGSAISSIVKNGQWFLGSNGVTRATGKRGSIYVCENVVRTGTKFVDFPPQVLKAQQVVREITGIDNGGSIPSCARKITKWTGLQQRYRRECERMFDNRRWHFYLCKPGKYDKTNYFDVKSCYFSIISSAPSPYLWVDASKKKVIFQPLKPREQDLWDKALRGIREHKLLRNTLSGVLGGSAWRMRKGVDNFFTYFIEGFPKQIRGEVGPLPALQFLTVRTEWELCNIAVRQSNALYAVTDSVITRDKKPPQIWLDAGFEVRNEESGEAHILAPGSYKIGDKATFDYQRSMDWWLKTGQRGRLFTDGLDNEPEIDVAWHPWILERRRALQ